MDVDNVEGKIQINESNIPLVNKNKTNLSENTPEDSVDKKNEDYSRLKNTGQKHSQTHQLYFECKKSGQHFQTKTAIKINVIQDHQDKHTRQLEKSYEIQ